MGKAGQKTLLLVEDEAVILLATAAILERHGFTVITAGNGESAVEMARIHAGIDLILMDIDLGAGMDGPQAAEMILENHDRPLVFLSSHTEQAVVDRTERITSYGYIVKNSGETVLLASIRMAFRLWESEQRFRTAFENVQVGMVLTSPRGSLLRVNESFAEMLGYTRQEVTAADFTTLTHPDDVGANVANMQAMLRGETDRMHFSKRYLHRDGRVLWADISTILLRNSVGEPLHFVTHVRDTTEERRNQEYLRQSEHILSSTADGIAMLDETYRYRFVNRAYERFSGRSHESLIGVHVRDHLGNEYFEEHVKPNFDRCLAGESIEFRTWTTYPALGYRFVHVTYSPYRNENQKICGVIANTRDITAEREIQEELDRQREQYGQLLEAAPVAMLVVQDECVVYGNPCGAHLLGYASTQKLVGVAVMGHIGEKSRDRIRQRMEAIAKGRTNDAELTQIVRRDGSTIWTEAASIPVVYDGRPAALIIGRDITEQITTRERLKAAEAIAHLGHYEIDLTTGAAVWSDETYRLFGLDPARFSPTMESYASLIHEADRDAVYAHVQESERTGSDFDMVYRVVHSSGATRHIHSVGRLRRDGHGFPNGLLGTIRDVTVEVEAMNTLLETRNRLASVLSAVPTGIGVVQGKERTIVEANANLCAMTGYARGELLDRCARMLYPTVEEYEYVGLEKYRQIAEKGVGTVETHWRRKDGAIIDVLLSSAPVDPVDHSIGMTFTATDITERKQNERYIDALIREKEARAQEIQHRVKNTMNTMVSLLSMQIGALGEDSAAVAVLNDARSRLRSMEVLYGMLYQTGTHSAASAREYLVQLIRAVVGLFPVAGAVTPVVEIDELALDARDLSTLGLIVNELVTNSMKYAFCGPDPGVLTVAAHRHGQRVTVSVGDTGPGFSPDSAAAGSGFGLTMVRALVEQLGGTIRFDHENGTTAVLEWTEAVIDLGGLPTVAP